MKLSGFIRNRIISSFITFKRNNIMQKKSEINFKSYSTQKVLYLLLRAVST